MAKKNGKSTSTKKTGTKRKGKSTVGKRKTKAAASMRRIESTATPYMAVLGDSKPTMVVATIASQLNHEGRWPPNDSTKVMGSDYHYTAQTLTLFLMAVQWHLAHGTPGHAFNYSQWNMAKALKLDVAGLMRNVDGATT